MPDNNDSKVVILITFELYVQSTNARLFPGIESYKNWARLTDRAFVIYGDHKPAAVRDHLWQLMGPNDRLFTSILRSPSAWAGLPDEVSAWIRGRLR